MFRRTLIALFMYTLPGLIWSQSDIDSLRSTFTLSSNDSLKVLIGLQILEKDEANRHSFDEILNLARNQSNSYLIGSVYHALGQYFEDQYQHDSAFYYYDLGIDQFAKNGHYEQQAGINYRRAVMYYDLGQKKQDVWSRT